jgi:hypothetical protein
MLNALCGLFSIVLSSFVSAVMFIHPQSKFAFFTTFSEFSRSVHDTDLVQCKCDVSVAVLPLLERLAVDVQMH